MEESAEEEKMELTLPKDSDGLAADDHNHDCSSSHDHNLQQVQVPPSTASSTDDNDDNNFSTATGFDDLDPPRSRGEKIRDYILRALDSTCVQVMGFIVLFLVVLDGAIFFFFLMGWQTLCRPSMDCAPRNQIYNISVQILNGLFTYMAIVAMPWRCTNAIHAFGCGRPFRDHGDGKDLYGRQSPDIWFHIPLRHRRIITVTLLFNCIFQFINHGTRIIFWNYRLQNKYPGNLWTNLFFVSSMLCAAIGAVYLILIEGTVRKRNPGCFKPGPIQQISLWWQHKRRREQVQEISAAVDEMVTDTTQNKNGSVLGPSGEPIRGGLRMFGL